MYPDRGHRVMSFVLVAVALSMLALIVPGPAHSQDVLLQGRVQWIAALKMMLLPEFGSVPVNVDLVQVPLEQYATLIQGNQVIVGGVISEDGRRVIASSVALRSAVGE